jgi:uncharacterized membrane protein
MASAGSGGSRGRDSLYLSLVPLPAAFFIATLVSDVWFWRTGAALWWDASEWLLAAGLATGAYAAADGLILYVAEGGIRSSRVGWIHVVGSMLSLLLSVSNLVYRLNLDQGRTVVPTGICLTAIVVCLLLLTARAGCDTPAAVVADPADDVEPFWEDLPELAEAVNAAPTSSIRRAAKKRSAPKRSRHPERHVGKSQRILTTRATRFSDR